MFVRAGLSEPTINPRQLRKTLTNDSGMANISHIYIGHVRDAFAEMIKACYKRKVEAVVAASALRADGVVDRPVVVTHLHDEASMRFRSYDNVFLHDFGDHPDEVVFSRGRYSKVQNNVLTVAFDAISINWPAELQPLARKDGPTLATAIIGAVKGVLDACDAGAAARGAKAVTLLHILVGDAVNTNENAAKKVLHHFLVAGNLASAIRYRLLVWKCSSHQSNLVVLVAIAGGLVSKVLEKNELCATLSRLYKYLVPAYLDEFTGALRELVVSSLTLRHDLDSEETKVHQEHSQGLASLYGSKILPPELLDLRNRNLGAMEHVAAAGADIRAIRRKMFDLLLRLVWVVEEKPVVTRFFYSPLASSHWCGCSCSAYPYAFFQSAP